MSSSDSSFSVPGVSSGSLLAISRRDDRTRGAHTLDLLLLLGLLSSGTTSGGSGTTGSGGTTTGTNVGQEVLDILALKSL
jgi:hypothetical protein